jgi:hypothetical protein
VIGGDKKHRQRIQRCTTAPATAGLSSQLKSAQSDHESADQALKAANQIRAALDRTTVERNVTDATDAYRKAVSNSQLHSFTAMVFGKDPAEVTEAEIAKFLRVFRLPSSHPRIACVNTFGDDGCPTPVAKAERTARDHRG